MLKQTGPAGQAMQLGLGKPYVIWCIIIWEHYFYQRITHVQILKQPYFLKT